MSEMRERDGYKYVTIGPDSEMFQSYAKKRVGEVVSLSMAVLHFAVGDDKARIDELTELHDQIMAAIDKQVVVNNDFEDIALYGMVASSMTMTFLSKEEFARFKLDLADMPKADGGSDG